MGESRRDALQPGQNSVAGAPERKIIGVKFHDSVNLGGGHESRSLTIPHDKCTLVSVPGGIEAQTLPGAARPDWLFVPYGNIVHIKYLPAKAAEPVAS